MTEDELEDCDFSTCPRCEEHKTVWHCDHRDCLWRRCSVTTCTLSVFDPTNGSQMNSRRKMN